MGRVYYNKLIRDAIPEKIRKNGESFETRVITDNEEFEQELLKKVVEEAGALAHVHTRDEFLAEYADLMAVLDALTFHYEFSNADIRDAIIKNVTKKGLFKERFFLHWSDDGKYKSNETPQGIEKKS